jgi:hypothetical protein
MDDLRAASVDFLTSGNIFSRPASIGHDLRHARGVRVYKRIAEERVSAGGAAR